MANGAKIGEVCDVSISDGAVKGLLLEKGAIFKKTFMIPIHSISSFGRDGIMIDNKQSIKPLKKPSDFSFTHHHRLSGRMMMTNEGERLGLLEDVYFLEEVGTIVGYELSDGFFSDVLEGRRVIKTDEPPAIGKDAIIINVKM